MNIDFVPVRNRLTGEVGRIARHLFNNPVINKDGILEEVEPDAKSYVKELYKAKEKPAAQRKAPEPKKEDKD